MSYKENKVLRLKPQILIDCTALTIFGVIYGYLSVSVNIQAEEQGEVDDGDGEDDAAEEDAFEAVAEILLLALTL